MSDFTPHHSPMSRVEHHCIPYLHVPTSTTPHVISAPGFFISPFSTKLIIIHIKHLKAIVLIKEGFCQSFLSQPSQELKAKPNQLTGGIKREKTRGWLLIWRDKT